MTQRSTIPRRIESVVLFDNDHTCCVCRQHGKDVQIHHIDGDITNTKASNLAVLCMDCHSRVTGTRGLGRRYTASEVTKYKRHWELSVKRRRNQIRSTHLSFSKVERNAFRIEIRKNLFYLTATQDLTRVQEILEFLERYAFVEGEASWILEELYAFVPFIYDDNKASLIAQHIREFFGYLIGPDYVKIGKSDKAELHKAIELVQWIGEFGALIEGPKSVARSLKALFELSDVAYWYDLKAHRRKIIGAIESIEKHVKDSMFSPVVRANLTESAHRYLRRIGAR
jgi:hypothetical protein